MNDKFNEQKDILVSIQKEIKLLYQQVDYLIRNEKPLALLDLDVLMNRTHTLYDQLCSINLGDVTPFPDAADHLLDADQPLGSAAHPLSSAAHPLGDDEELPVSLEEIRSLFGIGEELPPTEPPAETPIESLTESTPPTESPIESLTESPSPTESPIESPTESPSPTEPQAPTSPTEPLQPLEPLERLEHLDPLSPLEDEDEDHETLLDKEMSDDEEENVPAPQEEEETPEVDEDAYFIEEPEDVEDMPAAPEEVPEAEEEIKEEAETKEPEAVKSEADDFGFILNFEPVSEPTPEPTPVPTPEPVSEPTPELSPEPLEPLEHLDPLAPPEPTPEEPSPAPTTFTTGDEIEMTIPHPAQLTPEPTSEPTPEPAPEPLDSLEPLEPLDPLASPEPIPAPSAPVVIGDMETSDDNGFELEQPETLGDRYQQQQEETLGERLQHSSVNDLQKAIGINDKFLFVNELFSGSMEKYNRSIENLNDLKTLNGALIYINELRIELQWNSNNEAYKKLLELVHRKFEA